MNQAAKTAVIRAARQAAAADRLAHRRAYRRAMVNPITVDEHMGQYVGDAGAALQLFAAAHPDLARLDGADALFAEVYGGDR